MANTEEIAFAEDVRRTLGRALADLGLGGRDRAIDALGALLTRAETIVHGTAMAEESTRPDRYALAGLKVNLGAEAPELREE